jgi:CRP-like cAMP-binding protein
VSTETLLPVARKLLRSHRTRAAAPADLAQALSVGQRQDWPAGQILCEEGEPSDSLFVLLLGTIRVLRRDTSGTLRELATLEAPALVGQMGVVDRSPRSARCEAAGDVQVLSIQVDDFHRLLRETSAASAALRRLLLSSLIQQLSSANQKVRELAAAPAGQPEEETVSSGDILQLAGVLDGWSVDRQALDQEVSFTEDEDMRRTRDSQRRRR